MPVVSNNFTGGAPLVGTGKTGAQTFRFIYAPRVFIKATPDSVTAAVPPVVKSNGTTSTITATGWSDLGIINGALKVGYTKKTKEVRTGIDNYLRAAYVNEKGGSLQFELAQFDDTVMSGLSNLSASQITSNSIYTYHVGQEDLQTLALLFISVNKLNGKEVQFYTPLAYVNFEFADSGDSLVMKATALLPSFTASGQTNEEFLLTTFFA